MADLRPRPRRHALLAADADHAGERRSAAGGVGVSHEAGRVAHRRTCRRTGSGRRQRSRGRHASGRRPGPRPRAWRFGLRVERSHAARHQRHDVSRDAVLPRRRARCRRRARKRGRSSCPPAIRRRAASSTGPATRRRRRRSSSARATASCIRWTRRPAKPNEAFGDKGVVDLNTPEILQGLPGSNGLSSPPIVYKNLVITGGHDAGESAERAGGRRPRVGHAHRQAGVDVPLDSARRREIRRHVGRRQLEEPLGRERLGLHHRGRQRGIVYMPFGAPSVDQYGGDRAGRQPVRHQHRRGRCEHRQVSVALPGRASRHLGRGPGGIAPALIDVKQGGKTIPAVAVINKVGLLFLLDRVTGKPIYGVEERPVPPSEVPLERASKTQPFPLKPAPLSRMTMRRATSRPSRRSSRRPARS